MFVYLKGRVKEKDIIFSHPLIHSLNGCNKAPSKKLLPGPLQVIGPPSVAFPGKLTVSWMRTEEAET